MAIHRPLILGKPEPMPEELLRHVVASLANRDVLNLSAEMGRRLLADRDYHAQRADGAELHEERLRQWLNATEAEVARLRSRVRVEAEDVERAGVTPAKVASWLRENRPRYPTPCADAAPSLLAYIIYDNAPSAAQTWCVLDEMARMEVPA